MAEHDKHDYEHDQVQYGDQSLHAAFEQNIKEMPPKNYDRR